MSKRAYGVLPQWIKEILWAANGNPVSRREIVQGVILMDPDIKSNNVNSTLYRMEKNGEILKHSPKHFYLPNRKPSHWLKIKPEPDPELTGKVVFDESGVVEKVVVAPQVKIIQNLVHEIDTLRGEIQLLADKRDELLVQIVELNEKRTRIEDALEVLREYAPATH